MQQTVSDYPKVLVSTMHPRVTSHERGTAPSPKHPEPSPTASSCAGGAVEAEDEKALLVLLNKRCSELVDGKEALQVRLPPVTAASAFDLVMHADIVGRDALNAQRHPQLICPARAGCAQLSFPQSSLGTWTACVGIICMSGSMQASAALQELIQHVHRHDVTSCKGIWTPAWTRWRLTAQP